MNTCCLQPCPGRLVAIFLTFAVPSLRADWPQWRGPERTDLSKETGLLQSWPKEGPRQLWLSKDAGLGYSGPAIVQNKLYTMGARQDTAALRAIKIA